MRRLLITLALVPGCYDPEPDPIPELADEAIEVVLGVYRAAGAPDFELAAVHWFLPIDDFPGGVAWQEADGCHIRVAWDGAERLYRTALAHELVHCALFAMEGDANGAHDHPWWRTVVVEANEALGAPAQGSLDCGPDPCEEPDPERFDCLRAEIDECGACETFHCPDAAISVCQRACLPPEP